MTKCLSISFMQTNGYKPAPLDLSHVKLTPNQNTLVERLAENGHNVWARDRVRQGWTYSIMQVLPVLVCSDLFFCEWIPLIVVCTEILIEAHILFRTSPTDAILV